MENDVALVARVRWLVGGVGLLFSAALVIAVLLIAAQDSIAAATFDGHDSYGGNKT